MQGCRYAHPFGGYGRTRGMDLAKRGSGPVSWVVSFVVRRWPAGVGWSGSPPGRDLELEHLTPYGAVTARLCRNTQGRRWRQPVLPGGRMVAPFRPGTRDRPL